MGGGNRGDDDERNVARHLKVFVGGLPDNVPEHALGQHFARYGHVASVSIVHPKDVDGNRKSPYAFVTYSLAADADCAVTDIQHFPGASRPLSMGFATPRRKDESKDNRNADGDPCKVFVGGINDKDSEEQVGDFFSQWGLVTLVYRDRGNFGFVQFATKEGANRLLEEGSVVLQRRRLDIKPSDSKRGMDDSEREELIKRSIARHFHKKSTQQALPAPMPQHPGYPPAGYPGYPPPGPYGAPPAGYPGYPPAGPGGYPPPAGPGGYPPQGGYPPSGYPGYPPPGPYGQGPPPSAGYPGYPPGPGGPGAEPQRALPAPGGDPYAAIAPPGGAPGYPPADPYNRGAPAPGGGGYYGGGGAPPGADPYGRAPSHGAPPQDSRYAPY